MLSILTDILCVLEKMAVLIVNAFVAAFNATIIAIAALIGVVLALFPDMPEAPAPPDVELLKYVNWLFPLVPALATFAVMGALFLVVLGFRVLLNWLKAL